MTSKLSRPRKKRVLEREGYFYVSAWLPESLVEALEPEIQKAKKEVEIVLKQVDK